MKAEPSFVSDTYLGILLAQLKNEGYSAFVVRGDLAQCEADYILDTFSDDELPFRGCTSSKKSSPHGEDSLLQVAIAESLKEMGSSKNTLLPDTLKEQKINLSQDELRKKRLQKYAPY